MTHSPKSSSAVLISPLLSASTSNVIWHIKAPKNFTDEHIDHISDLKPWHEILVNEVVQFSQFLFSQKECKEQPELIALAFWCRKSNLHTIKADFTHIEKSGSRQPIGKVFHITPANVDTVFFYSLLLSVLSGNKNVVRISERSGKLCRQLIQLLQQFLLTEHPELMSSLVSIVEYSATEVSTTEVFSRWCDLRVVWGGDSAIEAISNIAPETPQLSFPDRFSIAAIHLSDNDIENLPSIATKFIADFLPFNQQACSSPKALFWLKTQEALQQKFYDELTLQLARHPQQFRVSEQVERQVNLQELTLIKSNRILTQRHNDVICYIELENVDGEILCKHSGNGLLITKNIDSINELPQDDKLQTISYSGLQEKYFSRVKCKRVCSIGLALAFNHHWDGISLLDLFTKRK